MPGTNPPSYASEHTPSLELITPAPSATRLPVPAPAATPKRPLAVHGWMSDLLDQLDDDDLPRS